MKRKRLVSMLLICIFLFPFGVLTEEKETPAPPQAAQETPVETGAQEKEKTEKSAGEETKKPAEKTQEKKKDQQVVISFLGDCTIGGEDRIRDYSFSFDTLLQNFGYDYFFENLKPVLSGDDLTVANLEGVLYDSKNGKVKGKTYNFRGLTDYVNVLTGSSVECVNLANNHTMDYGKAGIKSTVETLDQAGVAWFGSNAAYNRTYIYTKGDVKIGFVGSEISFYDRNKETVETKIKELKKAGCQVIVGVMHGGAEYMVSRQTSQERTGRRLVDLGCNLVIGHHPHVLQGMEVYKGATICYSIGNCVFGGNKLFKRVRARYGAIFQVAFSFNGDSKYLGHQVNIIPFNTSSNPNETRNNYQPVLASGEQAQYILKFIQNDTPDFQLKPYQEEVGAVQDFVPVPQKKK